MNLNSNETIKLSDYVIRFLKEEYNIHTVFTLCGAGCMHLIDSLSNIDGINFIANHHEQACSLAAEGYARLTNSLGACIVTTGPGGTNAITGTLCSWQDSIPVIVISGQVNRSMTTSFTNLNMRQLGDQEFNIIQMVSNITKYAVQVNSPNEIRYHLEKACYLATHGRKGPVWIDIPLDVQSAKIIPEQLEGYIHEEEEFFNLSYVHEVIEKLKEAERPLLIVGNGIRLSDGVDELKEFLNKTEIPVITSMNGIDLVNESYKSYYGRYGTHGQICANKIINECDLMLAIGTRLYVRQIGYNFKNFAKNAYRIVVDIDQSELDKPTIFPDLKIRADAKNFIESLNQFSIPKATPEWLSHCNSLRAPKVLDRHRNRKDICTSYCLIEKLSKHLDSKFDVVTSDGSALIITMQVLELKNNQRIFSNKGCAPLGYGLPAAIGAAVNKDILCIEGDGSLHLNVHELQTVRHNNLPIKILLITNDGYLSMKITQKVFFNGKLVAADPSSGVSFPNYEKVADVYGLPYFKINNNDEIDEVLPKFLNFDGPCICEVMVDPNEVHEPKVMAKFDENGNFIPGRLENISWSEDW
jgi:acetolactate synthase-1/2/3 large subunit